MWRLHRAASMCVLPMSSAQPWKHDGEAATSHCGSTRPQHAGGHLSRSSLMRFATSVATASAAVRGALTPTQALQLEHSLRQALVKGPLPITHLTRKLSDATVDILDDLDGSLLQYMERSKKFLVRSVPDGRKVVSLAPCELVTTIKGDCRKPLIAVHDVIAQHPFAHLVGGLSFAEIEGKLTAAQRKQVRTASGGFAALLLSFREVFDVDERSGKVRLVDQSTPVDMAALSAAVSLTNAAVTAVGGASNSAMPHLVVDAPAKSLVGVPGVAPAAPPPPRTSGGAPSQQQRYRNAQQQLRLDGLLPLMRQYVPFDAFVPLDALLEVRSVQHELMVLLDMPSSMDDCSVLPQDKHHNIVKALLPLIEAMPSTELDCRIFASASGGRPDEDASLVFLRMVVSDTQQPTADLQGDALFASRYHTHDAALLLNTVAQHYAETLPPDILQQWVADMTTQPPPHTQGVVLGAEAGVRGRGAGAPPMPLPPISLAALGAMLSESPQWATERPAAVAIGTDDGNPSGAEGPMLLLMLERHSHVFEVNWGTYEFRLRGEVFAAWVVCRRRQMPTFTATTPSSTNGSASSPFADGQSDAAPSTSSSAATLGSASSSAATLGSSSMPTMAEVMGYAMEVPALAQRMAVLDLNTTPVPRAMHSISQLVEHMHTLRHGGVGAGGPPTIACLADALSPSDAECTRRAFGSVPVALRCHPLIFLLRTHDGGPLRPQTEGPTNDDAPPPAASTTPTVWTLGLIGRLHRAAAPMQYGEKEWSDNVIAQAIADSLPDDGESCVLWSAHRLQLLREYTSIIPVDILQRNFPLTFFADRPHLFEVFEPIMNRWNSFAVGRTGTPPPLGCHPKHCRDLRSAIRQMAIVSVGGISADACMMYVSSEARTWLKRYGGVRAVVDRIPQWFQMEGGMVTYVGAAGATSTHAFIASKQSEEHRDDCD